MWSKLDGSTAKLLIQLLIKVISQQGLLQYFTFKHVRCFYIEHSRHSEPVKLMGLTKQLKGSEPDGAPQKSVLIKGVRAL